MKTLTVAELKARFSEVLSQMAADDQPVAISYGRRKEKVAALVPYRMVAAPGPRALGVLQGRARFKLREDFAISDEELLGRMKLLLDTHAFLWAAFSPRKLSARARAAVVDSENVVAVSSLSFWELSLKFSLGKISLEGCTPDELPEVARQMSFEILTADASDMASFHALPRLAHKDPFDRMIIWQAICQGWTLVSKDAALEAYKDHDLSIFW